MAHFNTQNAFSSVGSCFSGGSERVCGGAFALPATAPLARSCSLERSVVDGTTRAHNLRNTHQRAPDNFAVWMRCSKGCAMNIALSPPLFLPLAAPLPRRVEATKPSGQVSNCRVGRARDCKMASNVNRSKYRNMITAHPNLRDSRCFFSNDSCRVNVQCITF